jgi:uncharacterized membrane-anchored protein
MMTSVIFLAAILAVVLYMTNEQRRRPVLIESD